MLRNIASLIGILFITNILLAQNYNSFPTGEFWQFPDARTLGLAGSGSISNNQVSAMILNPAGLGKNKSRIAVQFSIEGRKLEERRGFPVYNRIDDIVQSGIYAVNSAWYPQIQGGILVGLHVKPLTFLKTLAMGIYNELDQDYLYQEEVRENIFGDSLFAFNEIEQEGKLTRYAMAAGFKFGRKLHFGIQIGFLQGNLKKDSSITFVKLGFEDVNSQTRRNLDNTPLVASLGLIYDVNAFLSLGSHVQLPYTLEYRFRTQNLNLPDNNIESEGRELLEYPLKWNVGLEYRARQRLQARLNIDFAYEWWANVSRRVEIDQRQTKKSTLDNVAVVKVGVEHIFFNQIPFRVGLQYRTSYQNRFTSRTLITAGTGFSGRSWQIDVAGGFSKLSYRFPDLFPDTLYGGNRSNSPIDTVEENYFFGMATLKITIR